jgi:hypothetical protein
MSKVESRRKPHNRAPFVGFSPENVLLLERCMTAAACARTATTTDRTPHAGSIVAASRSDRGKALGRIPQTSIQERYS